MTKITNNLDSNERFENYCDMLAELANYMVDEYENHDGISDMGLKTTIAEIANKYLRVNRF